MKSKLLLGDCLQVMAQMQDKSIDLVITDPPYIVDTKGGGLYSTNDKRYTKDIAGMSNGFSTAVLDELCRVMKKINIYIFCSGKQIPILLDYFVTKRRCNFNLISWHKSNPIPACGNKYISDTEYILFFREKGVRIYGTVDTKRTYYITPLNVKDKRMYNHPTCKPVDILKNLIINSSMEHEIILDPFMGSGSTGSAYKELNRSFVGIEIDPDYYQTAFSRINK